MNIYHIGVTSFENESSERELKAIGGIQGYILELIVFLLSKKIPVGFIGKIYNYGNTKQLTYHEIQNDVTSTNKFLIYLFLKSFFIRLPKNAIIHGHRPDHLAAFTFINNRPSVLSLHGQQARTVNERKGKVVRIIYNTMEKFALKRAKAIVAVDDVTKEFYIKRYPKYEKKISVIPTGVNTEVFKPLDKQEIREKFGFSEADKVILYVGRIEPPKKVDDIVHAFKTLVAQDKSYKLVLVGDGVMLDKIKNLSKKLKLEANISFFGIRKRNELPEIFNLSDISVLYSKNEGSPLSIKESLACGIPVVANCVGDVTEVIKDGYNGYLVEEENIDELALKMKTAMLEATSLKKNCVASIQNYTIEKVNQKIVDLYKKVLNEK